MGLVDARSVWWLSRGLIGACFATSFIVIESWLNDRADNSNRGFVFSVYTIVNLTVITLGQLVIMLGSIETLQLFAVAAILVSLATLPVVVSAAQAPVPPEHIHVRLGYLFRRSRVAMVAGIGVGMVNGSFWTLGPLFAQQGSGDVAMTAIFMSLTVIAGALAQWPLGHLSDNMDRRWVLVLASLGACAGAAVLVGLSSAGPVTTYVGAVIFGAFAFPMYALCAAHLNDFIEPDGFVEAASGLLMAFAAGAVVGPLLASALMDAFGASSLYVFTACVHLLVAAYALHRIRAKEPTEEAGQASFADALVMTSMAAEIEVHTQPDEEGSTSAAP
jgi:MFS family permease